MFPFLVDRAQLYEKFIAAWLAVPGKLPAHVDVRAQERVYYGQDAAAHFRIDLALYDVAAKVPLCVPDTKYKTPVVPAPEDVSQVVTYAHAKGCTEAILLYPQPLSQPLDATIGQIRVRSLTFALDRDLDQAGRDFLYPYRHPTRRARRSRPARRRHESASHVHCCGAGGLGADIPNMEQQAVDADLNLVIGGCPIDCAGTIFTRHGLMNVQYVGSNDLGVAKKKAVPVTDAELEKVLARCRDMREVRA
jgi:uncharacterized metal-binding protein